MPVRESRAQAFRILVAMLSAALALTTNAAVPSAPAPSGFRYWDPLGDSASIPKTLSATGLYAGTPGKNAKLIPQAHHYEVNVPEWKDGAVKRHWVVLKPGRSIAFREKDDYWGYPDSAVFVEEIAIDTIPGDTASRVLWETRVLVNKRDTLYGDTLSDDWYGFSYKWRKNQTDADLVDMVHGHDDSLRIWPKGAGKPRSIKKWHFPTIYQCRNCHRSTVSQAVHGRSLLGFFTAQLNRSTPDTADMNQLDWLFSNGVLKGQKPAAWDLSPRWRGIGDSGAGVDLRARSYIAANCSGCHGSRGIMNSATQGLNENYDFHVMQPQMELRDARVPYSFGRDTIPPFFYKPNDPANVTHGDSVPIVPALIVPGYPEKSVLIFRMTARDTEPGNYDVIRNQMPPLATYGADTSALALLDRWVREMGVATTALGHGPRPAAGDIRLQGRILIVASGGSLGNTKVTHDDAGISMASLDGRRVELRRLSAGMYEVPAALPKGLYFIRAGTRLVLRALF